MTTETTHVPDRIDASHPSAKQSVPSGAWFEAAFRKHASYSAAPPTPQTWLNACAASCREELQRRWAITQAADRAHLAGLTAGEARRIHYISMEFLMGRATANAVAALGLNEAADRALAAHGTSFAALAEREGDAALGNGGLGRLAACFLDSFAELGLPAFGYGLRYQYGMFAQRIVDGQQNEVPDEWLRDRTPWEVARPELRYRIGFGGRVSGDATNRLWTPSEVVNAQAYDFIVPAHHSEHVCTLRQWHASATKPIDFDALSRGDHTGASHATMRADSLNWVLYPDDSTQAGRELRLRQEAFLVGASVQDMLARHAQEGGTARNFADKNIIHLNDTHPALAPLELMRVLLDEHKLPWDEAWEVTQSACSYTNHTLMPEALETWPVSMFEVLLPRHMDIAYQINAMLLKEVRSRFPGDEGLVQRVSLIDEQGDRRIRMATLAIVASRRVNGVSALHSQLMVQTLFADFAKLYPGRFFNVTNGVTPRRWLAQANPGLSLVLDQRLGTGWRRDLAAIEDLKAHAQDPSLARDLQSVKLKNKKALAAWAQARMGVQIDPNTLFDVQIKRIHEYKRQLMNLLQVVARWHAMVAAPEVAWTPRTVIISGKAASAYRAAKQVIRLANDMAEVINNDPRTRGRLKLVFIADYGVNVAEHVIPAADLSEQISTAGAEASGTGNMKFALNGALTIGTWDGANIEMAQAMGERQMFVFGMRAEQVAALRASGYNPSSFIDQQAQLAAVLNAIAGGVFSPQEPTRYQELIDNLRHQDRYLVAADFADYLTAQARVDALFANPTAWHACAARNIAGMGSFTSDRAIADYVKHVWALPA